MKEKMRIYIITHKLSELPKGLEPDMYQPLFVGAACNKKLASGEIKLPPEYVRDDSGENISAKNGEYCELTGLYWMWKNSAEDIVGLCHYRRFFTSATCKFNNILLKKNQVKLPSARVEKVLEHYDIVMHNRTFLKSTVYEHSAANHGGEYFDTIREILSENYPDYIADYDEVMNRHYVHFLNMFIMRKELMDDYCEWLFGVLTRLEEINERREGDYSRLYGFLSERLFDVWVCHRKLRVKEMFTINLERVDTKILV